MFTNQYKTDWLKHITLGMEFAIIFGLCLGGGLWLDRRLGIFPALTLTGMVLGFAGGLYRLVRQAKELAQQGRREQQEHDRPPDARDAEPPRPRP
jgi:F0F1-type ATP synthase assembly protein I